jgi:transcriptional regulator with GAF, ATPase, and Fis domain
VRAVLPMEPKLIALTGPLRGESFPGKGKVTIGREPSNTVHISDVSISRQHCVINDGKLFDLDSLNGTFVDEVPVKERLLQHGDRIQVGNSIFLWLEKEEKPDIEIGDSAGGSTIFLEPGSGSGALVKFANEIHRVRDLKQLRTRFVELLFEAIPAQKGALVFSENNVDEYSSVFAWDRISREKASVKISRTVCNQVFQKQEALLSNDIGKDFDQSESLMDAESKSVMAAPLFTSGKVSGLIYLENSAPFRSNDLQLLSAMTGIASVALENLQHLSWLVEENKTLRNEDAGDYGILGESSKIQEIFRFIKKASATDSTVLVLGESGTGKELVARALHSNSARSSRSFVAINCAALSEPLLESELFGHEKGAFTGAIAQKKGKLEIADQGTVFLDEVAELTPLLQAKLLRVLQEREFERVGGTHSIKVDIRVLAATNKNLREACKTGSFREDLFYRLNVLSVALPPLRERPGDVSLLATYFTAKFAAKLKRHISGISPAARNLLVNYDWPGNVRELENALEHAIVLGSEDVILPEDLPEYLLERETEQNLSQYHEGVQETKKQLILKAVENAGGNLTEAAKLLGVHPNYLHRLIRNLQLRDLLKK